MEPVPAPSSASRPGLLQPDGALHPDVSWPRFAWAGLLGVVFAGGCVALVIFAPAVAAQSRWITPLAAAALVWQQRWVGQARLVWFVLLVGGAGLALFVPDYSDVPVLVGCLTMMLLAWSRRSPSLLPASARREDAGSQ